MNVARHKTVRLRALALASEGRTDPLVITRGLVIVDGENNSMLIFLPWAVPERRVQSLV